MMKESSHRFSSGVTGIFGENSPNEDFHKGNFHSGSQPKSGNLL